MGPSRKAWPHEGDPWVSETPPGGDATVSLGDREAQGVMAAQSQVDIAVIAPAPDTFSQMISPPKFPPEEPPPYWPLKISPWGIGSPFHVGPPAGTLNGMEEGFEE